MVSSAGGSTAARRVYLSIYNWVVFFGWAEVLYRAASALLLENGGHEAVYAAVERPLLLAQTAALMETAMSCELNIFFVIACLVMVYVINPAVVAQILHSILGFVRSPVSVTLSQISGRLYLTWGILWSFPEAQSHILVTSLILSWSITEVIRYSFFGMRETFGFEPSWLLWLRYSTFLVLYPIGLLSEVGLIFVAMPSMKTSEKYCLRMPNKWNFTFDYHYASSVLTVLYIPGFPYLFRYMLAKRRKVLSAAKNA